MLLLAIDRVSVLSMSSTTRQGKSIISIQTINARLHHQSSEIIALCQQGFRRTVDARSTQRHIIPRAASYRYAVNWTSDKRSAGNPYATFRESRRRGTASGHPVPRSSNSLSRPSQGCTTPRSPGSFAGHFFPGIADPIFEFLPCPFVPSTPFAFRFGFDSCPILASVSRVRGQRFTIGIRILIVHRTTVDTGGEFVTSQSGRLRQCSKV